jgi:hypothetical protein
MLNQLNILLIHPLHHTKNTYLLANDRLHEIATDKFIKAFKLLDDCISTLCKFECGTSTIPSCPLLQADEAKTAKAKLKKAPKHAATPEASGMGLVTPDAKCQRTGKPSSVTPSVDDLASMLIYSGTDMMPSVNKANPAMRLCTVCPRVGHHCPCGTDCKLIHDLDITKWPDATFTKWSALIDQTHALEWNCKVINPAKVTACNAKLTASSLASATVAKAKKCKTNP